ncbi:MAG: adenylate/guanylate cyclase domain-containing protein [Desulfomonilaceae bacterium]|nr:adenylate/guanylate cyclase domain-containing protein [Desulfomonilaceae bacterium]
MISPRNSITVKISLLVLGSTCLVLALVVELMYTSSRDLIREEAKQSGLNLVMSLANQIEQDFLVVAKAADHFASLVESGTFGEEALLGHMKRTVTNTPELYGSATAFLPFRYKPTVERYAPYFYKSDTGVDFVQLGTESYNYLEKDWFRVPVNTRKPAWSEPYFDEGGGNTAMTTYSRPVFEKGSESSRGTMKAVVTADISLDSLNRLVNSKRVYSTGFLAVFSPSGRFVTSRSPERVMRDTIFDVADNRKHPEAQDIARRIVTEQSGFYDIGGGITGVDSYVAFARMDPPGWSLAAIMPRAELFAKIDDLRNKTYMLAGFGIALLVVAAALVARSVSRPLRLMARETVKVAEGNLDVDLSSIRTSDEVGRLARAFTKMTEGLKDRDRIKDTFGRYLTQEVVKRLLDSKDGLKLGGEMRELSILMSDLRGFTALTSTMSPEQVIKFLNRYLGEMVDIILDHRGIIDEIIGDGILAFFGAPEALENHPELAVACALKMQLAMEEINALNEADGLPHLEMGVAVNTGEVVVGNIGSEKRAKYGAVGAQVNFTGRVESFTVGGQILISAGTYERLSDLLDVGQVLDVEMKGVSGKVKLYDVKGISGRYERHLRDTDETLTALEEPVAVQVFRLDQKKMSDQGEEAGITKISLTSACVLFDKGISPWEDVRMVMGQSSAGHTAREMYGKVISVERVQAGVEGLVRFTSVSAPAYVLIRRLLGNGRRSNGDP